MGLGRNFLRRFITGMVQAVTNIAKKRAKTTGNMRPMIATNTAKPASTTKTRQIMPAVVFRLSGTPSLVCTWAP